MTLTILVSVSLLAFVVTARPYPLAGEDGSKVNTTGDANARGITGRSLREVVQGVFQSRTGQPLPGLPSSLTDTDIRVHLTSPSLLSSHLASLKLLEGLDAVKAVLPLPFSALASADGGEGDIDSVQLSELTDEERELYELLKHSPASYVAPSVDTQGSLDDIDGGLRPVPELLAPSVEFISDAPPVRPATNLDEPSTPSVHSAGNTPMASSRALLVLTVSALAALLTVVCISLSIYTAHYFRKHVLRRGGELPWDVVPRVEDGGDSTDGDDVADGRRIITDQGGETMEGDERQRSIQVKEKVVEKDLIDFESPVLPVRIGLVTVNHHTLKEEEKAMASSNGENCLHLNTNVDDYSTDGEEEGLNEKSALYDAEDGEVASPLLFVHGELTPQRCLPDHPHIVVDAADAEDPDFLPLPILPTSPSQFGPNSPCATPLVSHSPSPHLKPVPEVEPLIMPPSLKRLPSQSQLQMREREREPVSLPAWAGRAADAPALGIHTSASASSTSLPYIGSPGAPTARTPSPTAAMPGALFLEEPEPQMAEVVPRERRAYRAPMPELDMAFALQLRPGLGLGAEGAWLVRFLMAMFGWLGVVVGGGGVAQDRRERLVLTV